MAAVRRLADMTAPSLDPEVRHALELAMAELAAAACKVIPDNEFGGLPTVESPRPGEVEASHLEESPMESTRPGGVLLATHGGAKAAAAVRAAELFVKRRQVTMEAFGVIEPVSSDLLSLIPTAADFDDERRRMMADAMRTQLHEAGIDDVEIVVERGFRAECITQRASETQAALIAMGIGPHGLTERLLTGEAVIDVIRRAAMPVLAAVSRSALPAKTIVIGTDFSASSIKAAGLAMALAADDVSVHLVHAWPFMDVHDSDGPVWRHVYRTGAESLFAKMRETIGLPNGARVATHIVQGEPETVIRHIAQQEAADLIAVGSRGRQFIERLTLGSVAESVVRSATATVIVAPPTPS
jgi:nucleotide-binding universal stress UspA family protein